VSNLLGYSRRLTIVVVPLALALSTGTIETSVDRTIAAAAEQQLSAAIHADLVVTSTTSQEQLTRVQAAPGVTDVVPLADVPVQVRTDQGDGPDGLVWERSSLRTVPPGASTDVFDPGVTRGTLAALGQPGTVALSSDAAFQIGLGVGESLDVRVDGRERGLLVVAVYERGLGVGDYLTGPTTVRELGAQVDSSVVLLRSADPAGATAAIRELGLTVDTPQHYVATATEAAAAQQRVSSVLVLLLLIFVGIAAADALVLSTTSRRDELTLLNRIGTTRPQLLGMAAIEALITALLAWVIGTVSVVPGVLAGSAALLGWATPVVDLPVYGLLSAAVLVTALGATLVPAAVISRVRPAPTGIAVQLTTSEAGPRSGRNRPVVGG
jgi:putative ABC transport system permease protein